MNGEPEWRVDPSLPVFLEFERCDRCDCPRRCVFKCHGNRHVQQAFTCFSVALLNPDAVSFNVIVVENVDKTQDSVCLPINFIEPPCGTPTGTSSSGQRPLRYSSGLDAAIDDFPLGCLCTRLAKRRPPAIAYPTARLHFSLFRRALCAVSLGQYCGDIPQLKLR